MNELAVSALSSAVVSALFSSVIGGWFSLRTQQAGYKNDYYGRVLTRRMEAYEHVERIIANFRASVMDDTRQPYHIGLSGDTIDSLNELLFTTSLKATWFSNKMLEVTRELSVILHNCHPENESPIEFGKRNYRRLAELRTQIEATYARDMLTLHDVPRFLKEKKPTDHYEAI
jgi:hypothetical protein